MHASVPELVNLTISTEGTAAMTALASSFSRAQGAPKEVPFQKETVLEENKTSIMRGYTS